MASTAEIAKRYFAALSAHDLDAATACWRPGAIDRLVGSEDLVAPDGVRTYFSELFDAFPDFALEVVELTTVPDPHGGSLAGTGTFAGPGTFQGFSPNHARIAIEGCDVVTVEDELIVHNDAFIDTGAIARQLGFLPPAGSTAEARLAKLANLRTRAAMALHGAETERIADGVWVVRGGFPIKTMNVYLIEERRRRHRVRRRDLGDGRRPARRLCAPRRRPADRAQSRRRRPPRRRAGTADAGLLPSRRAGGRRVGPDVPRLLGPGQAQGLRAAVLRQDAALVGRRADSGRRHPERGRRGRGLSRRSSCPATHPG